MFYKAPQMTEEQALKDGLIPIHVNVLEIIDLSIKENSEDILKHWEIVKKYFTDKNVGWSTIGYITKDDHQNAQRWLMEKYLKENKETMRESNAASPEIIQDSNL